MKFNDIHVDQPLEQDELMENLLEQEFMLDEKQTIIDDEQSISLEFEQRNNSKYSCNSSHSSESSIPSCSSTSGNNNNHNKKGKKRPLRWTWKKPKGKPCRPMSAYNIFYKIESTKLKDKKKIGGFSNLSKMISEKWKTLSNDEKRIYQEQANEEKVKYHIAVEEWKNSQINQPIISSNNEEIMMNENSPYSSLETIVVISHPDNVVMNMTATASLPQEDLDTRSESDDNDNDNGGAMLHDFVQNYKSRDWCDDDDDAIEQGNSHGNLNASVEVVDDDDDDETGISLAPLYKAFMEQSIEDELEHRYLHGSQENLEWSHAPSRDPRTYLVRQEYDAMIPPPLHRNRTITNAFRPEYNPCVSMNQVASRQRDDDDDNSVFRQDPIEQKVESSIFRRNHSMDDNSRLHTPNMTDAMIQRRWHSLDMNLTKVRMNENFGNIVHDNKNKRIMERHSHPNTNRLYHSQFSSQTPNISKASIEQLSATLDDESIEWLCSSLRK